MRFLWSLLVIAFFGCSQQNDRLFTLLGGGETGIHFKNTIREDENANVLNYTYFYNGGGVAIGDINNDGLQDVLFTGNMVSNRLYLNKGNFQFEDVTEKTGIASKQGWCTGATMTDVNGDGLVDIYICRSGDINAERRKNLLFINHGNLNFTEEAERYGVADEGYSTQGAFFDYDKDGDLDLFVINHSLKEYAGDVFQNPKLRNQKLPAFGSRLYRNDGNHFNDVSEQAGITSNVLSFGLGLLVSDINKDGWPDVYLSNDFNEPDYLFLNKGDGTFAEKLKDCMDQTSFYSMGLDCADYNNDGLPDLVTLDMLPEDNRTQKMHSGAENFDKFQTLFNNGFYYQYSRNMLQKANGDGAFSEVGQLAGVSNTDWSWAALFSDFDNDGYKDLFVTNGYAKDNTNMDFIKYRVDQIVKERNGGAQVSKVDLLSKMPSVYLSNYLFQADSEGHFVNKASQWGLGQKTISSGASYVDLDNDGDMDLVVNNLNEEAGIYRNNAEKVSPNHFLKVKLEGSEKNRTGIGAKLTLYCKKQLFYQEESPVRGFQSSVDPVLNFGLGKNSIIDSVVVVWNDGKVQKLTNVKANSLVSLKWKNANLQQPTAAPVASYFQKDSLLVFTHKENDFNDFTVQSLMPNFLSRQGPCMAEADINGDGLEDIFIGGAKGQSSAISIQTKEGKFARKRELALANDSLSEDIAAEFFDADGDGDKDLYVGSGGYEYSGNDPLLQDRLYFNDGKGDFSKNEKALPQSFISTGCVKAADVDGDGDLDLFVGGRVVPEKYPLPPESKILLNNGHGVFTDATQTTAPKLRDVGMVTDAVWIDVNGDKQEDLIVVGEWMPVKVFVNNKGKLSDASNQYIHFASTGWWNKILAADFDKDGDLDLVIGNCGENSQFKPTAKKPMTLYAKDFDGNGSVDPVLCYFIGDSSYPAASRDDLTDQLPLLKKRFLTYTDYADATINDLFTQEQLQGATVLKAETMQSVYLENRGNQGFIQHALPQEIQYAPVYATASADVNHDGKPDLLCAGNNSWTRIKFGRYEANHGMLFLGDGQNHFQYVPQGLSGLRIRGDVRSLQVVKGKESEVALFGVNDKVVQCYRF